MLKKSLTLILVAFMISPLFLTTYDSTITNLQGTSTESPTLAETDLGRVTYRANAFANGAFETWTNPHEPDELYTIRTLENRGWWEYTNVFEGVMAFGMNVRAMDENHYSEMYMTNQSQVYWDNPTNLTLDVEWYLDSIGNPVNQDYFRLQVRMDYRTMYYYLGCETTNVYNSTSNRYFMLDGATDTWNHLHRNLTADYFESFGELPSQYETMYWYIRSYTNEYTRIFLDDLWLVNGTTIKAGGSVSHGNFEGGGSWTWGSGSGPGDIAQCSDAHEGDWSMNMTALTFWDDAYAIAYYDARKTLTPDNQGNLTFWWKLDNYTNPSTSTYARIIINLENATTSFNFYYYLFVGGSGQSPFLAMGNDRKFNDVNFNVTGTWNQFNRNIWQDFSSYFTTENLWIDQIQFQVRNSANDARLSLLVDDVTFNTSILSDMDYEYQNAVGDNIQGWDAPPGNDELTVTNFTSSGNKAMNLTLTDGNEWGTDQKVGSLVVDDTTELIFDFNMYIDTFNESSDDFVYIQFDFDDSYLIYVLANASSAFESNIDEEDGQYFIVLQDTFTTGEWMNFQLDIVHDYESVHGSLPDDILTYLEMQGEVDVSSSLSIIFDDMYIYYDTAPEITAVGQNPATVTEANDLVVISAEVIDASALTVTLSYRVDGGSWVNLTMDETTPSNYTVDINAPWGETMYFITAVDAFGKTDTAMDGGNYFTFATEDTTDPVIVLEPANGSTVSDITYVSVQVSDVGSGVSGFEIFIDGVSLTNITDDNIAVSWDTTVIPNGEYNITVVAEDNAGNSATITHLVTVENLGVPVDMTGILLIIGIVAIAGIILVIYIFVIKKK